MRAARAPRQRRRGRPRRGRRSGAAASRVAAGRRPGAGMWAWAFVSIPSTSWRKLIGELRRWWQPWELWPPRPCRFARGIALTFLYALGYPVGALAVSVMSPMAVLVFRFGLAAAILAGWAMLAKCDLAQRPHADARPDQRTARPGRALHLPLRGVDAWRPCGAGCGDHLDEPRRHRGAGGDVPRREPDARCELARLRSECLRCSRPARDG